MPPEAQTSHADRTRPSDEALLKEYDTVVGQFRNLTDIRFKLLGLLPAGSIAGIIGLNAMKASVPLPLAGAFGAAIALALFVYHLRNDQLYNELVRRAAHIERELGLFNGSFLQRPGAWQRLAGGVRVEHGWPVQLVYVATIGLWLSVALSPAAKVLFPSPRPSAPADPAQANKAQPDKAQPDKAQADLESTLVVLLVVAPIGVGLVGLVSRSEGQSRKRYRKAVREAMDRLTQLHAWGPLLETELEEVARVLRRCLGETRSAEATYARRLKFYLKPEHRGPFLGATAAAGDPALGLEAATRALAQTIDMPARWIFDVYLERR